MILLQQGDHLPTVALIQILLNGHMHGTLLNTPLVVDGIFGRNTRAAVETYQREIMRTAPTGRINSNTWRHLCNGQNMLVRDMVDISDPLINEMAEIVRQQGSNPIIRGGSSNAVGEVVPSLMQSGVRPGTLVLLRFQGHGNRGVQVIGYGTGCFVYYDVIRRVDVPSLEQCIRDRPNVSPEDNAAVMDAMSRSNISNNSLDLPEVVQALRPLRRLMSPYGSIEFHGCQVGGGVHGARFLQRMANLVQVPCTAAQTRQRTSNAIRYSGPILTKFPNRSNLRRWARQLPLLRSTPPPLR